MFAEIIYTRAGGILLRTPYVREFIEDLKATVPKKYRVWDPEDKVWLIDSWYDDEVNELVSYYFPNNETIDLARNALVKQAPTWAKVLYIQPGAPREVAEAAYRTLAKKYHPDVGGSETKMRQLNDAIEKVRCVGVG